jgi:hypothetical protein
VLTQTAQLESTIASCSKSFLDKIDYFYDVEEWRLSQTCDEIEELHLVLRKQYEDAENLLNSNDTRRFIGVENGNIMKAVQSVDESHRFSRQLTQIHRTGLELSHSSQITIV